MTNSQSDTDFFSPFSFLFLVVTTEIFLIFEYRIILLMYTAPDANMAKNGGIHSIVPIFSEEDGVPFLKKTSILKNEKSFEK